MIKLGLLGWPTTYSLSPILFQAAFRTAGITGSYEIFPIQQRDFTVMVNHLREMGYTGVNITAPYKENAVKMAQEPSLDVLLAHATNLLHFLNDGRIAAHNTDITAITEAITASIGRKLKTDTALVLGGGGAAKAAIISLSRDLNMGSIMIAIRNPDQMTVWIRKLKNELKYSRITLLPWDKRDEYVRENPPQLIVNATTLGWRTCDPYPLSLPLPRDIKYILDLNYPPHNSWLEVVQKDGITCQDGLEVLLHQAALGFKIFTGQKAPLEAMRHAMEKPGVINGN